MVLPGSLLHVNYSEGKLNPNQQSNFFTLNDSDLALVDHVSLLMQFQFSRIFLHQPF